ncbi:MAG: hypothetical protein JWN99_909 [Ilumatobacteraceae bacterium]|nr:hypothetical protein [Ilumatobacteraceae bacterium]
MIDSGSSSTATVTGPVPGKVPMAPGQYDLTGLGYVEEEYVLHGTATSYAAVGERRSSGQWQAEPSEHAAFTTRIVVRRPSDATAFNGTVLVEWLNVSAGGDGAPDWSFLHRHIIREGMVWVGVSAQQVGIEGGGFMEGPNLKKVDPVRYASLSHPGDAFSFDIFTQAGRAVVDAGVLGPLVVERIVAIGESQSAAFLVTYVNGVDPLAQIFDGFIIHGRAAAGAPLSGSLMPRPANGEPFDLEKLRALAAHQTPERIRSDVRVPVITIQSETDTNNMGDNEARQADDDRFRLWEIAGTAHGDAYAVIAGPFDDGTLSAERLAELLAPSDRLFGMPTDGLMNSSAQQHYVTQAALAHFDRWLRDGTPPPQAPRLALRPEGGYELDAHGNALGGIRSPWVDVPTAVLSGLGGAGGGWASLFGTTVPFDQATLAAVHPGGVEQYVLDVRRSLSDAVESGFILAADVAEIEALLAASWPGQR